jgi:hypothetical protein
MNTIILSLILLFSLQVTKGQSNSENSILVFDHTDLEIIERADSLFSDKNKWSKEDDRACEDDIINEKYSLYCALYKAAIEITGEYSPKTCHANRKIHRGKI